MTDLAQARSAEMPVPGARTELLQLRVDAHTLYRLDRIVAHARGSGFSKYSRSYIAREALEAYLDGVEEQVPAVKEVVLTNADGQST
ncbi:MAG: hypothetical protein ABMA25_23740 [Ilumatobacteraceae bacterium]